MNMSKKMMLSLLAGCAFAGSVNAAESAAKWAVGSAYNFSGAVKDVVEWEQRQAYEMNKGLFLACEGSFKETKALLSRGAYVNYKNNCGYTPLHVACLRDFSDDIIKLLIEAGADVNAMNGSGTPLFRACCHLKYPFSIVKLLIDSGSNVNAIDYLGRTPLHVLCSRGNINPRYLAEVGKLLVDSGANIYAKDGGGRTPLDVVQNRQFFDTGVRRKLEQVLVDEHNRRATVFTLEALAKKDGGTEDGLKRPFNVMSLLPREVRCEVEEFATSEYPEYEGRGLSSESLNIKYTLQSKKKKN